MAPKQFPWDTAGTRLDQVLVLAILSNILMLAAYTWLISIGSWTNWPSDSTYYGQLATAFQHGQLWLEEEPSSALLALPDPYSPAERRGLSYPLDASLYKGRLYLYFGPVPALLLMAIRTAMPTDVSDEHLVFGFTYGIYLVESLLILRIWRRFFPDISPWIVGPSLLVAGLISPFGWALGRPTTYTAAIMGGQFFFLAGLYSAFSALDGASISNWRLALAGTFWAAALGSRITQILPIGFMAIVAATGIVRKCHQVGIPSGLGQFVLALALPLGLGVTILGWYNWARFDSVFETGIRYQLSGVYLQKYAHEFFSPLYVVQNLYNYLLAAPLAKYAFPYFSPLHGLKSSVVAYIQLPEIYRSAELTGLLYSCPFVLFGILPACRFWRRPSEGLIGREAQQSFDWLIGALAGSFITGFSFFLVFFWSAERYLGDFLPPLLILSVIGFWQLSRVFTARWYGRLLYRIVGFTLITASIVVSNLLALSINSDGFRALNPVFWRELSNLFRP